MKKIILLTVFISVATIAAFWTSRKVCGLCAGRCSAPAASYADLGLGTERQKELQGMDREFRKEADSLCGQVCRARMEALDLIKKQNADTAAIFKKIEEVGALQTLLEKKTAEHVLAVKKKLSAKEAERYLDQMDREMRKAMKLY